MDRNIYLVRHGTSVGNKLGVVCGWEDYDLDLEGVEEANATGKILDPVDSIRSSDLLRAKRTTDIINNYLKCSNVIYSPNLRERNYGGLEGKKYSDLSIDKKEMTGQDALDSIGKFVGVETIDHMKGRLVLTLDDIFNSDDQSVLWSSHGFANTVAASIFLGKELKVDDLYKQKRGQVGLFVLDENKRTIEFVPDYAKYKESLAKS